MMTRKNKNNSYVVTYAHQSCCSSVFTANICCAAVTTDGGKHQKTDERINLPNIPATNVLTYSHTRASGHIMNSKLLTFQNLFSLDGGLP